MMSFTLPQGSVFDAPSLHELGDVPFDSQRLDELMAAHGLDALIATSQPCVRYFTGGYYSHLFTHQESVGLSRYVAAAGYVRGQLQDSFFLGNTHEAAQFSGRPIWIPRIDTSSWNGQDVTSRLIEFLRSRSLDAGVVGLEMAHVPALMVDELRAACPHVTLTDAAEVFEEIRAVKTDAEVAILREVSNATVDAIVALAQHLQAGSSKDDIYATLRLEDARRVLAFHYALVAMGPNFNRLPNDDTLKLGAPLSVDHGGERLGYVSDIARVLVLGEPDRELIKLRSEVEAVQDEAMRSIRPGVTGFEIFESARAAQSSYENSSEMLFLAHGIGMNQIEAPRCVDRGPWAGPGNYEHKPLRAGMVISIESMRYSKTRGLIKLEDTGVVTSDGFENFSPRDRDWIVATP